MQRVARVTDGVLHQCGIVPLVQGSPKYLISNLNNSRVTDAVACGGVLVTGSATFSDQNLNVSRITDKAVCPPPCGVGIVVEGSARDYEA